MVMRTIKTIKECLTLCKDIWMDICENDIRYNKSESKVLKKLYETKFKNRFLNDCPCCDYVFRKKENWKFFREEGMSEICKKECPLLETWGNYDARVDYIHEVPCEYENSPYKKWLRAVGMRSKKEYSREIFTACIVKLLELDNKKEK